VKGVEVVVRRNVMKKNVWSFVREDYIACLEIYYKGCTFCRKVDYLHSKTIPSKELRPVIFYCCSMLLPSTYG